MPGATPPSTWRDGPRLGQGAQQCVRWRSCADAAGGPSAAIGGWEFGNTIDGCQAEYVLVPDAMANLAAVPDGLSDEQVLMCPDGALRVLRPGATLSSLGQIEEAYELFGHQRDGVLKVAITP